MILGFFDKLFGKSKKITKTSVVDVFTPMYKGFGNDITKSSVVVEAINSITKHASKVRLSHLVVDDNGKKAKGKPALNHILQYRPNKIENGAEFLEKAIYHWLVGNNVFIYLDLEPYNVLDGKEILKGMWVIDPYDVKATINDNQEVFLTFSIANETKEITTSIENVAVVKRLVGNNDLFGASNDSIKEVLSIINTNYQGVENAIKTSSFIKFIIESATVLSDDKRKARSEAFSEDFKRANVSGGVIFSDSANKITPIKAEPIHANYKEMDFFKQAVYSYFGTNDKIVKGEFNDDEWNAFYESTIAVFLNKLEIELTKKIFTSKEVAHGNRIVAEVEKLSLMSVSSKLKLISEVRDLGLLTLNEMRGFLNLPYIEDGDKRLVSLNYVNAEKQDEYQLSNLEESEKPKEEVEAEVDKENEEGKDNDTEV